MVVNHKDHNRDNNNINNLEAISQRLNSDDRKDVEYIEQLPDDAIALPDNFAQQFYYLPTTKQVVRTQCDAEKNMNKDHTAKYVIVKDRGNRTFPCYHAVKRDGKATYFSLTKLLQQVGKIYTELPKEAIFITDKYRDKIYALPNEEGFFDFIREDITYDGQHRYVPLNP